MRIVAGEYRGRVVKSPSEATTRPTTDRVRESMFSAIFSRMDLEGACVLDAFAGSGALGIEALSRGAARAVFFERDAKARDVLSANLSSLGIKVGRIRREDVFQAAQLPLAATAPFNLVLLDPPYAYEPEEVVGLVSQLAANGDLASGCVIVYEHSLDNKGKAEKCALDGGFEVTGQKKYGKIGVTFLAYNPSRA